MGGREAGRRFGVAGRSRMGGRGAGEPVQISMPAVPPPVNKEKDMSKTKTKEELRAEYEKFHEEAKENAPATTEISPKCRSAVPWLCGQGTKNEGMCLRDESHCNQTFTDNKQPLYTPTRDVMTDTRIEAVKKQLEEVVSKLDKNPLNRRLENNRKQRQKARLSSELEELRKLKATVETSFQYGKPSDKSDGKYLYYPYDEYDRAHSLSNRG